MTEVTQIVCSRFYVLELFENITFPDSKDGLWRLLILVRHKQRMSVTGQPTIRLKTATDTGFETLCSKPHVTDSRRIT